MKEARDDDRLFSAAKNSSACTTKYEPPSITAGHRNRQLYQVDLSSSDDDAYAKKENAVDAFSPVRKYNMTINKDKDRPSYYPLKAQPIDFYNVRKSPVDEVFSPQK